MSGYVPTHGPDCETRTYKTRCSHCRKTVFFFSLFVPERCLLRQPRA